MKNYIIAVVMAMVFTGTLSAQSVNLGVKGGLNVYNVTNNSEFNSKAGVHLGLLGHVHLANTSKWALQPEIMYSSQGARIGESSNRLNLDYLNVPVLIQYMFDNGFRLQAGPQLGFLVNANTVVGENKVDVKDDYKGVDLGLSFGASYVHPPSGFGIDARYNLGMTDIPRGTTEHRNNGFQLGVFYLFNHRH
jgi:hypothetical protein